MEMIEFPTWVTGPTPCATRTFSVTLTGHTHGAVKVVKSFKNRPMVRLRRKGLPGYYLGWA